MLYLIQSTRKSFINYLQLIINMPLNISTVSYLPGPIRTKIKRYQKQISEKFNTIGALDWVPHITIADRVLIPKDNFRNICSKLKEVCNNTKPIKVYTKNLYFIKLTKSPFENPYAIAIEVETTKELLRLHGLIQNDLYKKLKRPSLKSDKYSPHITLAYRDLTRENFEKAKQFFREHPIKLKYSLTINNIHLVVSLHNKQRRSVRRFEFEK